MTDHERREGFGTFRGGRLIRLDSRSTDRIMPTYLSRIELNPHSLAVLLPLPPRLRFSSFDFRRIDEFVNIDVPR